jgi:glycosyltransferase involved in cell wall biosynthesis
MSTVAPLTLEAHAGRRLTANVEIVVPVYNEERTLEASIVRLHDYLTAHFPLSWVVTIADNASQDRTWGIACRLTNELDRVQAIRLQEKGRGRALRAAWLASDAPVVAYTDVDLATDLDALLPLVAPLLSGHSDIAIGTRLARGARVVRGPKREIISRLYNLLLKATLGNQFSDAQCGFKAVRGEVAKRLVPIVEDNGWFFDTELLVLAEHYDLRIHEVAVDWIDDPDSRVDLVPTAVADLKGIWRLIRRLTTGKGDLPPMAPDPADRVDRVDRRRFGRRGRVRPYAWGPVLAGLPVVLAALALVTLRAAGITALPAELIVLGTAYGAGILGRDLLLHHWVFR